MNRYLHSGEIRRSWVIYEDEQPVPPAFDPTPAPPPSDPTQLGSSNQVHAPLTTYAIGGIVIGSIAIGIGIGY
ncbi:unnamed protein product, partial [Rotaria sp. Silwood2]